MSAISLRLTAAVRAADSRFETVGGSSRHYVNDCLLPALEAGRLVVVDVTVPAHAESAERDVASLGLKLDAAERVNADLGAALKALLTECEGRVSTFENRLRVMGDARAALKRAGVQ